MAISLKKITFILFATSLLGVYFFSIDIGLFQLSPYRIMLIISIILIPKIKKSTVHGLRNSLNYGYFLFMFLWVLYSIIPLLWVRDFSSWIKIYIFLTSGLITTWYVGLYFKKKSDIIIALKITEFMAVIFGGIAVYEIITGDFLFIGSDNIVHYQEVSQTYSSIGIRIPISIFGNPNNYSLFLLFSVFTSFGLSKIKISKKGRYMSLILMLFFIFLLIATQSRSGFLGLIIGFFAYFLTVLKRRNAKNIWNFFLIIIIGFLFIIPWLINNQDIVSPLTSVDFSGNDRVRVNLINNGLHFLINTLFLGVGLGNIEYHMSHSAIYPTWGIKNIHNWWMEILVSSGIFIFLYYLIIYFKNILRLYRFSSFKCDKDMHYLSAVFFSYLIGFLIASIGSSSLMNNEWIWSITAIVMSFINLYTEEHQRS